MSPWEFGNPGPVTRRLYDPNRKWPKFITLFKGKDDENFLDKTVHLSRYTALATGFFSMWDIVLMPHKGGIPTALSRIKWWAIPFIGGGITYTATVGTISGLRGGKSDHYNHLWGGFAVGAVLGKHAKSVQTGVVMGVLLGLFGVTCKDSAMHNWELFPDPPRHKRQGNAMLYKHDFTLKADRPGYWVRSEAEVPAMLERGQV